MIKIENLTKTFRTTEVETLALNKVSLEVRDKEFVAIMGPSGCGKSTLLNIMGLLDNPTSGSYFLDGKEVGSLKEKDRTNVRKGNIGFVFQSFNLIDELNVFENIELPLTYLKIPADERKRRVNEIMQRMNISIVQSIIRSSCRVVNSNVWPLPVLWFPDRRLFWPTSRPVTWIPRTDRK